MSIECVECGSRVHGCFPCHNCGCELPPLLSGQDAEIAKLREENERFKVMYKGFENQFYEIRRLRDALLKVANWYEDVHDTADFSGDTPSSYAKEFLVRSGVKI